ncbi:MAG TPA: OmpA family protein [Fulvivirga sp.]|nr:OmpA family protein [Fulvivirga sp.]
MKYTFLIALIAIVVNLHAQEYSGRYELVNLGRDVNTAYHEGAPVVSADGKTLYFFVHNHPDNTYGKEGSQDIWFSTLGENGKWGKAEHLGKPLNDRKANQVFTVMPDNKTLFIRGGSSKNGDGFSFTHKEGDSWSNPEEIDIEDFKKMNKGKFYGATVSSDAKFMILYFSEKENGTFSDLYVSKHIDGKKWSAPIKLSSNINTSRDEFAPFMAPDDKTMYYSSNRKDMGIGGSDIYKVVRQDDTWLNWSDPENVGRPLNTRAFDAYMSIDSHDNVFTTQSGNTIDGGNLDIFWLQLKDINIKLKGLVLDEKSRQGVIASLSISFDGKIIDTLMTQNEGVYNTLINDGKGHYTIRVAADGYHPGQEEFTLGEVTHDTTIIKDIYLRPFKKKVVLSGIVYNAKTNEPVTAALTISSLANDINLSQRSSDVGYYSTELIKRGLYQIAASAEGFLNQTDSIDFFDEEQLSYVKDIYLSPIEIGTTVRLKNIFFDFDKTTLKSESYVELDKVVTFLNDNASLEIEIAGHTDSKGADDYNQNLSQGRAQAVVDYLIGQGIEEYRLVAHGYGETVPLESNDTDEGRAFNRRVEFTVLKK